MGYGLLMLLIFCWGEGVVLRRKELREMMMSERAVTGGIELLLDGKWERVRVRDERTVQYGNGVFGSWLVWVHVHFGFWVE